jgi:hypothetical protein
MPGEWPSRVVSWRYCASKPQDASWGRCSVGNELGVPRSSRAAPSIRGRDPRTPSCGRDQSGYCPLPSARGCCRSRYTRRWPKHQRRCYGWPRSGSMASTKWVATRSRDRRTQEPRTLVRRRPWVQFPPWAPPAGNGGPRQCFVSRSARTRGIRRSARGSPRRCGRLRADQSAITLPSVGRPNL